MKKVFLVFAALCLLNAGCKKDVANVNLPPVTNPEKGPEVATGTPDAASALKGVNWAADGDNFSDGILVLSGLAHQIVMQQYLQRLMLFFRASRQTPALIR
jgi:endoglucanase